MAIFDYIFRYQLDYHGNNLSVELPVQSAADEMGHRIENQRISAIWFTYCSIWTGLLLHHRKEGIT